MRPNCGVLTKIQTYRLMRPIMRPVLWKMSTGFAYTRPIIGGGGFCTIADLVAQNTGSTFNAMDTTVTIGLYWSNPNISGYAYAKQNGSVIVSSDIRLAGPSIIVPYGYGGALVKCEPGDSYGAQLSIDMIVPTSQSGTFTVVNFTTYEAVSGSFSITP